MVDYNLIAGESWPRGGGVNTIRVKDGKDIWADINDCEARMQVRKGANVTAELVVDLTPKLNLDFDGNDILITWSLTGAETRQPLAGKFDCFLSDVGATDEKAIRVVTGTIKVKAATTSGSGS